MIRFLSVWKWKNHPKHQFCANLFLKIPLKRICKLWMLEPLLAPFNYVHFLNIALILHIPQCQWLAPHTADL
jgi:hypothetical protein